MSDDQRFLDGEEVCKYLFCEDVCDKKKPQYGSFDVITMLSLV